ncbi:MAG: hypothetical protein C5T88_02225 [Williamsoniiplasma luminosum]|uniref:Uncharacterized protein n=1 Tax=Williamsoniiplasma luminosum TaxID=214888 RepID=A0A2S0NK63_9MOLU|nr:MAG: hypothetical protein C5T88_02225 [Williamsoniiplasma luminosum]
MFKSTKIQKFKKSKSLNHFEIFMANIGKKFNFFVISKKSKSGGLKSLNLNPRALQTEMKCWIDN